MNLFMLNNSAIYFSIIFANRIEIKKNYKISSQIKLNVKISSLRLKPDSCQTHQHKTDRLTPDFSQTPLQAPL
jgi:hypothetical protein